LKKLLGLLGQGRHPGFGLQSLANSNGNSAFSMGGPPTLLAPNSQGPSSLHHLPRMMDLSNGFQQVSISVSGFISWTKLIL
jgi:hypothetical protein